MKTKETFEKPYMLQARKGARLAQVCAPATLDVLIVDVFFFCAFVLDKSEYDLSACIERNEEERGLFVFSVYDEKGDTVTRIFLTREESNEIALVTQFFDDNCDEFVIGR